MTQPGRLHPDGNMAPKEEVTAKNDLHQWLHSTLSESEALEHDIIIWQYELTDSRICTLDKLSKIQWLSIECWRKALQKLKYLLDFKCNIKNVSKKQVEHNMFYLRLAVISISIA